jgi:hypothetical protein
MRNEDIYNEVSEQERDAVEVALLEEILINLNK